MSTSFKFSDKSFTEDSTKSNTKGNFLRGFSPLAILVLLIVAAFALIPVVHSNSQALVVQAILGVQGYNLTFDEVKALRGNEDDLINVGDNGPKTAVNLNDVGEVEVYLSVVKTKSGTTEVLKYANDGSLVAPPNTIPKDSKENW